MRGCERHVGHDIGSCGDWAGEHSEYAPRGQNGTGADGHLWSPYFGEEKRNPAPRQSPSAMRLPANSSRGRLGAKSGATNIFRTGSAKSGNEAKNGDERRRSECRKSSPALLVTLNPKKI